MSTFTEFKNNFYSRVPDLTLFDCGDINLLKVVLDGLKVDYVSKGKVRSYALYNKILFKIIFLLKRFFNRKNNSLITITNDKDYLIIDTDRTIVDENNQHQSFYFKQLIDNLTLKKCLIVKDSKNKSKMFDLTDTDILQIYLYRKLNTHQLNFLKQLKATFLKIKSSNIFNKPDLSNIKFAFNKFFLEYIMYDNFLSEHNEIKKALFVCHYHKEGIIYALKKNKIKCIELQHGLIANQDIFYILPKNILQTKQDLLFADYIGVYGEYWKNKLLKGFEYKTETIFVIGNYQTELTIKNEEYKKLITLSKNEILILVTTQTFLSNDYINFIKKIINVLEKNKKKVIIVIKPHPYESSDLYINAFSGNSNVVITSLPVSTLFEFIKINITSYSTTVFDAIKYNVTNYVFKLEQTTDYVNNLIDEKIATELNLENLNFIDSQINKIDQNYFYSKFDVKALLEI